MYTNTDGTMGMNDPWREVQKVLSEYREEVLPLMRACQGGSMEEVALW